METLRFIARSMLAVATISVLAACEPPTPDALPNRIPDYTRQKDWSNWAARVATYNVWGLPVISKDKEQRMPAIGKAISARGLDVALLQESWLRDGRDEIFYNSGMAHRSRFTVKNTLGSGLMIMSQHPISRRSYRPFQLYGPIFLPDAWAIKGVGMSSSAISGLPVSYYSTHLMAGLPRAKDKRSSFTPEWKMEMFEVIAHVIEQTDSDAFVIGGDFNVSMMAEEYEFWKRLTSLDGTYLEERFGDCTWCADNTYAKGSENARQIDYIFVSPRLQLNQAWVDFKERIKIKKKSRSLSDHYGITAEINVVRGDTNLAPETVRFNFRESLRDLRSELESYYLLKVEEEKAQGEMKSQGLDDRVCLTCRIKESLKMISRYEEALDQETGHSFEMAHLKSRIESYFDLFK